MYCGCIARPGDINAIQRSMLSSIGSILILRSKLDTDRYGAPIPRQNLLLVYYRAIAEDECTLEI